MLLVALKLYVQTARSSDFLRRRRCSVPINYDIYILNYIIIKHTATFIKVGYSHSEILREGVAEKY